MGKEQQQVHLRVDAYTRVCLTIIAALLTVLIIGLWAEGVHPAREAMGVNGIPDSGLQRNQMIKALEASTAKLDKLITLFESGSAKVQVVGGDEKAGKKGVVKGDAK
ncbi:MAG: hypothetical protein WBF17_18990 [Phycisphaerae bacterium]